MAPPPNAAPIPRTSCCGVNDDIVAFLTSPHWRQRNPTGPWTAHFGQIGWSQRPHRTYVSLFGWR